jgi:hypothetical protein
VVRFLTQLFGKTRTRTTPVGRTRLGVEQLGNRVMPAVTALASAVDVSGLARGGQSLPYSTSALSSDGGERSVASASNGNYAVVWKDIGASGATGAGIYTRLFNSAGTALTGPMFVPGSNAASTQSTIAMSPTTGNFVVAWTQPYAPNPSDLDILAQRFHSNGTALGGTMQLAYSTAAESQPSLAFEGNWIVAAYTRSVPGVSNVVIRGYDFNTGSQLATYDVTSDPTHSSYQPSLAWRQDGQYMAVAYTYAYSSTDQDVRLQPLSADFFYPVPRFDITRYAIKVAQTSLNEFEPSLALTNHGEAVVAYSRQGGTSLLGLTFPGGPQQVYATEVNMRPGVMSAPIRAVDPIFNGTHAEAHPSVSFLHDVYPSDTEFVLTYALNYQPPTSVTTDWDVHGQLFNYYSGQFSNDFTVAASGSQETSASVASDGNGHFEVVYGNDRDWSKTDNIVRNGDLFADHFEGVFARRYSGW